MQQMKVNFPSDNDKAAQAAGAVTTSNIHRPLKLAEFNRMDKAAKKHYLQWLSDTFNASDKDIGDLLGASQSSIYNQRRALGLELERRRMSNDQRAAWEAFLKEREPLIAQQKPAEKPAPAPDRAEDKAEPYVDRAVEQLRSIMQAEYKRGWNDAIRAVVKELAEEWGK